MNQLSVAVYVRLQLQNTKDEFRGTTQTCTARSNERGGRKEGGRRKERGKREREHVHVHVDIYTSVK